MKSGNRRFAYSFALWLILAIAALWCWHIGHNHWWRWTLLTSLAAASFIVGSLIGFVFTTYGDESNTIGKVRDWAVGALAGFTIAKFSALHAVLLLFAITNTAADYALTLAVALVFAGLGFYFMFFGRELLFNIPLAKKRAERFLIENTHQAGIITIQLNTTLPSSILMGDADADSLFENHPALKESLKSPAVTEFLEHAEQAITAGQSLDWDIVSKVANLQYYRAYLAEEDQRSEQREVALEWIMRALVLNPDHVDLTVKRADVLALLERYRETVAVLEGLYPRPDCPIFVEQWLGYYLLWIPGREDEAIQCCQSYLTRFPESNEALRNLASGYAQKACLTAKKTSTPLDTNSPEYKKALERLQEVVLSNPEYLPTIRTQWVAPKGSFSCFGQDPGFLKIVANTPRTPNTPAGS